MTWRYRVTLLFFLFFFFSILARLFYWQVVRAEELAALGQDQYGRIVKLNPQRGEIITSDGFAIAANKLSYLVFANPKEIKDVNEESAVLSTLLDEDTASISALLSLNRYWVALKSHVDRQTKEKIEPLHIPGVGFEEQTVRFYPEASTAAKLLGFVGKDENGNDKGYFGLEGYYDRQLHGKTGLAVQIHDALGQPILAKMNDTVGEVDGRNLILHVDRTIQFLLDNTLKSGIEEYGAASGMAAVMDPKTGGILAMSSFPTFDPRDYQNYSDSLYRNPFLSDTYEPGSTFKPLIMASALDAGFLTPDTRCTICAGPVAIGGYDIHTWNDQYNANETMTQVIQHSDNTGMVFVGRKLGEDRMLSYIKKFGIGDLTGIDLQGEGTPPTRADNQWYPIDLATATFGQGITVTPIELLTAFSAIANDGKMMEPHVVSAVQTPDGETIPILPKVVSQPVSAQTAKVMTEMMVNAVDNGEAKWAKPKGYRIAGKTGTAQIPIAGHYDANKTIASFIGFAPAENPKFLMLVIIDRPTTSIYGAETAAPVFFKVAKDIMTYYGIPPSE
ncbi:MAG TPA: penicillin-binding protein 2 [Methylomirabilota bacterium]|nr:penicillin-binding protein 2 [Methylomirabilota bacterium]